MSIRCCCPRSSDCLPRGRYAAINCLPSCAAMPTSSITPGSTGALIRTASLDDGPTGPVIPHASAAACMSCHGPGYGKLQNAWKASVDARVAALKGQLQASAGAMGFEPRILMMDEPFGALDEITRDNLNEQLQQLWQRERRTVVFVTHSIPEAVYLSNRVVVMSPRPGRVTQIVDVNIDGERSDATRDNAAFFEGITAVREALRGVEMSDHVRGIEDR